MATTVPEGFNALRSRIALTSSQVETADNRAAALKRFLASDFELASAPVLVGSYARNTIVRPERDIDLLVPLNYGVYKDTAAGDDSRALLYLVRNALDERYKYTKVSSQQIAVKLNFTDITVDVVPAFPRSGGGYLVADGSRGWQSTNPVFHTSYMASANLAQNRKLKTIVKLMKYWNLVNGHHLSSLHIELMIAKMWTGIEMGDRAISDLLAATLRAMPGWVSSSFDDPWEGNAISIGAYLTSGHRQTAYNLLSSDSNAAAVAEERRKAGNISGAFDRWDVVFRHNFPAYG